MNSLKSVVFDVGNVLFAYDPAKILREILPESKHHGLYLNHLFLADIWQLMDRGDLSASEAVDQLASQYGADHRESFERCIAQFADHLDPMLTSIEWFQKIQKYLPVYILSNFQDQPFDQLMERYPFLSTASGTVVSAKEGVKKPEPEIFDILASRYKLVPSETLFIDDIPDNIKTAQKLGFQTIHYHSPEQLHRELSQRFD